MMNKLMTEWNEQSGLSKNPANEIAPDSCSQKEHALLDDNACLIEKFYAIRRKRNEVFDPQLFSDPAWDILLDLYMSEKSQKGTCAASACARDGRLPSTGLRWISILVRNGYVEQQEDPSGAGRSLLSLTPSARAALEGLFN